MLELAFKLILQMSLIASIIAIVVILFRLIFKSKVPKFLLVCLWALVFIKLILPFEIPSPTSLYNQVFTKQITSVVTHTFAPNNQNKDLNTTELQVTQPIQNNNSKIPVSPSIIAILSIIWISGAGLVFLALCIIFIITKRHFRITMFLQDNWITELILKQKYLSKIRVGTMPGILSPIVIGVIKPIIILPDNLDLNNTNDLQYILIHEINHIKRFDNLWNMLALFAVCVHWFNPLVWISYFLLTKDIEASCDENVLRKFGENEKVTYANVIVNFAKYRKSINTTFLMGFGQTSIKQRVIAIMNYKKIKTFSFIASIMFVLSVAVIFGTNAIIKTNAVNVLPSNPSIKLISNIIENPSLYSADDFISDYSNFYNIYEITNRGGADIFIDAILFNNIRFKANNEENMLNIYSYNSTEEMEADSLCIDSGGNSYHNEKYDYTLNGMEHIYLLNFSPVSDPHYYKKGKIIVEYVGKNIEIISNLERIFGEQFAGYINS